MTDPEDRRPSLLPILGALAILGLGLATVLLLRHFRGSEPLPEDAGVGWAVVGQNDALQRGDYADFRSFTCTAQQGVEAQVLADQRQSAAAKGARYVDDVKDVAVTGDRATATVVYHFEKAADDKFDTPMTFIRENGTWKVCSPGPR